MAIGWLTVLKLVPWVEVVRNAPEIADGAKKLWDTVGRKRASSPTGTAAPAPASAQRIADLPPVAAMQAMQAMQSRLDEAEAAIALLNEQMQASSTLIKALADQNTELIRRVEINRVRVLRLAVGVAVLGLVVALALLAGVPR